MVTKYKISQSFKAVFPVFLIIYVDLFDTTDAVLSVNATPEYIHQCHRTDPQLNSCIKQIFNHLRPYIVNGIDELSVPPIEPLLIPKMQMENGHGAVRVRAILSNMTIHGASNYTVLNVRSDLNKLRVDLGIFIPHLEATGNYDVNGNVLLLPVRSRGDFWASFDNVTALAKLYGVEVKKDGVTFMKTERLGVGFKLESSDFKIKDYINRQNVIGEAMNVFLNENSAEIIEEMKPAASQAIGKHFKNFLNTAFLQIPMKVWLKDD
ncbi:circadian clock-controlled protein daywake-like [Daktulosphaira vitifoliae]|uniref:circadian clock-controlled protein daywake-like n=1 Tax=Daktulosphaira vitifoliae TaxID=58002 RepID=UPI0021A9A058|nr:circadian clock-controlled protein daywake-like [Daktulosphaira vitifoliae]